MRFGKFSVDLSTTAPNWYLRCQLETVIIAGLVSIDELCLFEVKTLLEFVCIRLKRFRRMHMQWYVDIQYCNEALTSQENFNVSRITFPFSQFQFWTNYS